MSDACIDTPAKKLPLGPSPKHIRLISGDGHEFIVPEEVAFNSPTIVTMMNGPAQANGECPLTRIPSHLLVILVRYLHYKKINPSATWLRGSPPPSFGVPSSLRIDASYAADFLGLINHGVSNDYIRLRSADGHVFIVKKEIALLSPRIKEMLSKIPLDSSGEVNYRELELDLGDPFKKWQQWLNEDEEVLEYPLALVSYRTLRLAVNYLVQMNAGIPTFRFFDQESFFFTVHFLLVGL